MRQEADGGGGGGAGGRGSHENMTVEEYRPMQYTVLRAVLLSPPRRSGLENTYEWGYEDKLNSLN